MKADIICILPFQEELEYKASMTHSKGVLRYVNYLIDSLGNVLLKINNC